MTFIFNSNLVLLSLIVFILNAYSVKCEFSSDCYRAAVYEHILQGNVTTDEPSTIIEKNLKVYKEIATKAAENGANILVYPEDGLIDPMYSRDIVATFVEQIPDPRKGTFNPCDNPSQYKSSPITLSLSCFAKTNHLYIVADYGDRVQCNHTLDTNCPTDGHYMFNTAVAFSSDGSLVAKYHKTHLFEEFGYNTPPTVEFVYFDTPFGRLGLHICFDMMFKDPGIQDVVKYGVQTMVFPTYWFDELPLRSAKQLQEGWATVNRVNLLAANVLNLKTGSIGSGIYSGENGPIVYSDITTKTAKLFVADIPINSHNTSASCLTKRFNKTVSIESLKTDSEYKSVETLYTKGLTLKKLVDKQNSSVVCDNGFCCQLNYSVVSELSLRDESYWLFVVNSSAHPYTQNYPMCEETCGVFRCDDDSCQSFPTKSKTVFESLRLSAKFTTNYTYPSLTSNDLTLVPKQYWIYENNGQIGSEVKLNLENFDKPLLAMALYGRCFDKDPPPPYKFNHTFE